jgi:hypothetical protein
MRPVFRFLLIFLCISSDPLISLIVSSSRGVHPVNEQRVVQMVGIVPAAAGEQP